MPEPVNLALAFSLTPQGALEYFRAKGYRVNPDGWAAVEAAAHRKAFTVARVASLDLLQDIKTAMDAAIADGTTFRQFQQTLMPKMKALGWWGKDERGVQLGSPHRLSTIFRTNVQTSYMEGRWQGLMDNVDNRPWIEYVAILDNRTRPGHRALSGKVFRYDDPFWQTMRPPIGWNCRCRIRALSDKDLERRGITPDQGEGNLKAYSPEAQGYRQPQAGYVDPRTGNETRTDVGWGYDRLEGWKPDPQRHAPALQPLLEQVTQEAQAQTMPPKQHIPVANALTLPKSGPVKQVANSVLSAIDKVHSDGSLPKIPVKNGRGNWQGAYYHLRNGDADSIALNTGRSVNYELTMAHEIGHFMDHHGFGKPATWASEIDAEFAEWRDAIKNSAATKALESIKASGVMAERKSASYYLKPWEQWARSYAQWLAVRSGEADMLEQVQRILSRQVNTAYQASQWADDDFQDIAAAIDKIFAARGWLK